MKKSKIGCLAAILISLMLIISVFVFILMVWLPKEVQGEYGKKASSSLSIIQKLSYPLELYQAKDLLTGPMTISAEETKFEIEEGQSVAMISLRLEDKGLIPSAELFRTFLIYFGMDRNVQTGIFSLSGAMSPAEIAEAITDPLAKDIAFVILPGWRIEEIAQSLDKSGFAFDGQAFKKLAYSPSTELASIINMQPNQSLEGYLFPGNYTFSRDISLEVFIQSITEEFSNEMSVSLQEAISNKGLSMHEAVTLASIIEREAVIDEEKPLIASVFYNRLSLDMRLETDPTVQYALGYNTSLDTWWKVPLSYSDLEVVSEYNTYLNYGLPPGPICNPDLLSISAVAYPADTPYYYFRATCDGSNKHNFAITYEEHLSNACP